MGEPERGIAQRLRVTRERLGLTQEECATALGVTRSAYTWYETGRSAIKAADLQRLAEYLGVPVGHLTGEEAGPSLDDPDLELMFHQLQGLDERGRASVQALVRHLWEERRKERGAGR